MNKLAILAFFAACATNPPPSSDPGSGGTTTDPGTSPDAGMQTPPPPPSPTPSEPSGGSATIDGTTQEFTYGTWKHLSNQWHFTLGASDQSGNLLRRIRISVILTGHTIAAGDYDCSAYGDAPSSTYVTASYTGADTDNHDTTVAPNGSCHLTVADDPNSSAQVHVTFSATIPDANGSFVTLTDGKGTLDPTP